MLSSYATELIEGSELKKSELQRKRKIEQRKENANEEGDYKRMTKEGKKMDSIIKPSVAVK